jgi:hypothetical protein
VNRDTSLAGYWPGPWPGEDGGPRRTQTPGEGFSLGLQTGERLAARSRNLMVAHMTILRDPGEVYVQGHSGAGLNTTGWVERIDPESLETVHRSPGLAAGPMWPGGIAAHRNGDLYVTYGRWCHRLDPECNPVASRELPRDRPYNSLLILPDGNLVMKDFAGGDGVHALPGGVRGSELVILEPERLEIIARCELPEGSIARLSADVAADGTPRVYAIGDRHAMRLLWDTKGAALTLDETWIVEYLRFDGQTFSWDAVIDAGSAWFLDNGEGTTAFGPSFRGKGMATAPLHLVRIPLDVVTPEPEFLEVCGRPGGIIANPPAVDASRRIAVGYDSGNGVMTAWRFGEPGEAERIWQRDQDQAGHMMLLPESGELVCYDYDHAAGTETCVVLDIETGEEKARIAVNSPVQCVVFPSPGWDRDIYVTTFTTVTRVTVFRGPAHHPER